MHIYIYPPSLDHSKILEIRVRIISMTVVDNKTVLKEGTIPSNRRIWVDYYYLLLKLIIFGTARI